MIAEKSVLTTHINNLPCHSCGITGINIIGIKSNMKARLNVCCACLTVEALNETKIPRLELRAATSKLSTIVAKPISQLYIRT